MDHVTALVDALPPPLPLHPENYVDDIRLKRLFISADEVKGFLAGDRGLAEFMKGPGGEGSRVVSLLAMENQEKVSLTEDHSGDVVIRDVRQVIVTFDGHRLMDPTGDEGETRRLLMRRAFDHLLGMALRRLTGVKAEQEELEERRALLETKLNILQRGEWGFDEADPSGRVVVDEAEAQIGEIDAQLQVMGGNDRILSRYLDIVSDILGRPEEHLWGRNETIFIGPMGVKRSEAARDAAGLTYSELRNADGRRLVVMLVSLEMEGLKRLLS
jgi:hypothetical protein